MTGIGLKGGPGAVLDASSTDPVPDDGTGWRYRVIPVPDDGILPIPCSMGSTVGSDGLITIKDRDRASIHELSPSSDDRPIANQGLRCVDEEAIRFWSSVGFWSSGHDVSRSPSIRSDLSRYNSCDRRPTRCRCAPGPSSFFFTSDHLIPPRDRPSFSPVDTVEPTLQYVTTHPAPRPAG